MIKVNWGIIGLGKVASQFANGFKYTSNANLLGAASQNRDRLNKFREDYSIIDNYCFEDYQRLIENKDIDIIYIALPTALHFEWIVKCLKKDKKVLVEKPATINSLEAVNIKKNFINSKAFFTEAFMYLYHPQIVKVLKLIKSGEIGKIILMESVFGHDILTKRNFLGFEKRKKLNSENRLYNKKMGGGAILDLGCYPVSFSTLIASLISPINYKNIEVLNIKKEIGSTGVDLDSYAELKFQNNFTSKIAASFTRNLGTKTKIIGTEGEIVIENTWTGNPSKIKIKKNNKEKVININSIENIYSYEIEAISQYILNSKTEADFAYLTIDNIIGNMKIIDRWLS